MSEQLTISQVINLPGVQFTHHGIAFAAQATDETVIDVGRRVHLMRGFGKWAQASVFAEMIKRRDGDEKWANEFSQTLQIDPKERREILAVYTFYPLAVRTLPLSYEHYREAMFAVSDGEPHALDRALGFLHAAHSRQQTVSQMRLMIRRAARGEPAEPTQSDLAIIRYAVVYEFRRFAAHELEHLDQMTPDRAALILNDLGEGPKFIDYLRTVAGPMPQNIEGEGAAG